MRLLFARAIDQGWIASTPTRVIQYKRERSRKSKDEIKYLTRSQLKAIFDVVAASNLTEYNKLRMRALLGVLRWSGLRISDAVKLRALNVRNDANVTPISSDSRT
jgi:site-specific recombinase XerD